VRDRTTKQVDGAFGDPAGRVFHDTQELHGHPGELEGVSYLEGIGGMRFWMCKGGGVGCHQDLDDA